MLLYYQFNTCSALYHHLLSQSHVKQMVFSTADTTYIYIYIYIYTAYLDNLPKNIQIRRFPIRNSRQHVLLSVHSCKTGRQKGMLAVTDLPVNNSTATLSPLHTGGDSF